MFVSVFDSSAEGHTSALYQLVPALGGVLYRGYRRMFDVLRTGSTCCRLTYKEAAVGGTDSKPEHETSIGDPAVLPTLFAALGLDVIIELTKRCTNYSFDYAGYRMLATVVTVPELEGTWLEVETQVAGAGDVPAALDAIRALLGELGIAPDDLDSRTYTGLVADARRSRDSGHDRKFVQGLPGSDGA
jgi:adenylate cyclase class IV